MLKMLETLEMFDRAFGPCLKCGSNSSHKRSDPASEAIQRFKQAKRSNNSNGFTLVELLVVVAILATVGVVAANMFFQTLKGASKAELTKLVKQEGDYAISVMERMIRNAKSVDSSCSGDSYSIQITNQDANWTNFSCYGDPDFFIASESADLSGSSARITSNKVVVSSSCGQFVNCSQTGSAPPVVEIEFDLSQRDSSPRPEERASMHFRTTVSLRTY